MSRCLHALHRVTRAAFPGLCALAVLIGGSNSAAAQTISTIAGTTDITGRPARSISVNPAGMVVASDGSVYVADSLHAQVLRFDPVAQTFTLVAGTTVAGYSGDGGPATSAQLNYPGALTLDGTGNLLVAEMGNGRIRRINLASGQISTVAGGGTSTADGELASNALLDGPAGIAVGPDGSIYVSEFEGHRVRRVAPNGQIFTIAGTGIQGQEGDPVGDEGPAALAQLAHPSALAFDALGNLYISDQAHWSIRMIDSATGIIHRFAGTTVPAMPGMDVIDGLPALQTPFGSVTAMAFDAQGNLIYTDTHLGRVRKIEAGTTLVTTLGGGGWEFEGVPATNGRLDMPYGIALASNGDIYVSSQFTYLIQRISGTTGMLEVMAGNGVHHFSGDGGSALLAQITPSNSVVNAAGDVFIAEESRIRKIDHNTGFISTYAGGAECCNVGDGGPAVDAYLWGTKSLAIDGSGNLYVSDSSDRRVRKITAATGIITAYAGTYYGISGDNIPAINAKMESVRDLVADSAGNLFILQDTVSRVRRVDAVTGMITTIAGNGQTSGPLNDGSLATQVAVPYPDSVAVDSQGNVYVTSQLRIRKIAAGTGIITTVAGNGTYGEAGDGGPALNASLNLYDIAVDAAGNIFIIGFETNRVRKIDAATGIITTVAGTGDVGHAGDGGPALLAKLHNPRSLGLNGTGDLLVNDTFHVRRIAGIAAIPTPPDTTPPQIWYTLSTPTTSAAGWHNTNVTVTWGIFEQQSAVSSTSGCATTTVTTDTAGLILTCTATSGGGTTSKSVTIKRDTVPPTMTYGAPTPAANAAGWNNTDVTIPYTKSDSLSGIPGNPSGSLLAINEGTNVGFSTAFIDIAGNSAQYTSPLVKIDKTAPTATIGTPLNGATYSVGVAVLASYSCGDSLSGIGSCVGTVPNGTALDTATVGTKTFLITVTDLAGNVATVSRTYTVTNTPPPAPTYCSSRGMSSGFEWIRSVQLGSWSFTSNNNSGYGNFTTNPISVVRGANSIVLTPGFNSTTYVENWRVWIDFNQDGTLGSDELVVTGSGSAAQSKTLTIPTTALAGNTRMRIVMAWGGAAGPCGNFSYGEVEDYRVTIP